MRVGSLIGTRFTEKDMSPRRRGIIGITMCVIVAATTGIVAYQLWSADGPPKIVELQRTLIDVVDEDELKQELKRVHPVLPPGKQSRYQAFVTPDDAAVMAVADEIDGAAHCYARAVRWTWVSDPTLNGVKEKWLMPREFLEGTPTYGRNPVAPKVASDCEEQANTLASVLRADGTPAGEVRVVLGRVNFGGEIGGHAWVEVLQDNTWLPLETTSSPFWDDDKGKWFPRNGYPFEYFSRHEYPVEEVWAYYNDVYYLDPRAGSGNAPDSWRQPAPLEAVP